MKAALKNMLMAYTGKCDGLVFYYNPRLDRVLVRSMPRFTPNENNHRMGRISRNLKALQPSEGFRLDLVTYTELYRKEWKDYSCNGWYNLFNKMMWAMHRLLGVDLETLTRNEIETLELPCRSVKSAVEGGLLPPVSGWQRLEQLM